MTKAFARSRRPISLTAFVAAGVMALFLWAHPAAAQVTAFKQAIAEAASDDKDIAAFYRTTGYSAIWTGSSDMDRARRAALIQALSSADLHGLPSNRYDPAGLMTQMSQADTTRDLGFLEVELSRAFLDYARDVQSGILVPSKVDSGLVREVLYRDRATTLAEFALSSPVGFMNTLPPQTPEYRAMMKEKLQLERLISEGGWGKNIPSSALKPGQSGDAVIAMRDRLIRMGYLSRSATESYDSDIESAVKSFQQAHGLEDDGVAGKGTVTEINVSPDQRLKSVIVAMERERWLNRERGPRHILVNLTDFTAKIIDNGRITFQTRSIVGKNTSDRRSPEFSDTMEHMIINPSWYVPRSIITKEYLPQLKANPNAASQFEITDSRGRRVDRNAVDFTQYSARSFPFAMREPPSSRNALGLVKFMFPNKHNIYLHDTPAKSLFSREMRAFSHGCIRLADPFDFAYALLARQTETPKSDFQGILATKRETKIVLEQPLPVHIIYRTAFTNSEGKTEFRRDMYGRDGRIWDALSQAGVALGTVQG